MNVTTSGVVPLPTPDAGLTLNPAWTEPPPPAGTPATMPLRIGKSDEAEIVTVLPRMFEMIGVMIPKSQSMLTWARPPRSVPPGKVALRDRVGELRS